MSRGKNLQEMEAGTTQSKTAVNAGSKGAEPMKKLTTGIPDGQSTSGKILVDQHQIIILMMKMAQQNLEMHLPH